MLDDLLKRSGWSPLDRIPLDQLAEGQRNAALELASRYRRLFEENEDGKAILALLVQGTIMRPIVHPTATQFEAGIREGRADFVRGILFQIELAKTGETFKKPKT